ncbi:MAG TPA: hypothetical protein VK983_03235 [Candidatus Limnocylindrales bacterium]|nr:hypothetical protein [Candidatus Limnocylindrales bacterium]
MAYDPYPQQPKSTLPEWMHDGEAALERRMDPCIPEAFDLGIIGVTYDNLMQNSVIMLRIQVNHSSAKWEELL